MTHNTPQFKIHLEKGFVRMGDVQHQTTNPHREIVGNFSNRADFQAAVTELCRSGFTHDDLSVLSSHQSIEASQPDEQPWRDVLIGLTGEIRYEGPLVAAGLIALASGPVGIVVSALVAAEVGGAAVKELFDNLVARPKSEEFARALTAGNIILWVNAPDSLKELKATDILTRHNAHDVHVCQRSPTP